MNKKIFENVRFTPKGDTEANWNRAVGFVPLEKEIIIYKPDEKHSVARVKVGDGKTAVQDLPFVTEGDGMNDVWVIRPNSLQITPIGETGIWQVRVDVLSSLNPEPIKIIAYANVARNTELYPRTLGYYVADFNAYRIGQ